MRCAPLFLVLLAACGPAYLRGTEDCPTGYVPVDRLHGEFAGRAISAEGVVIAVRTRDHKPQGTLDFWTSVVKKELIEGKGYAFKSGKDLQDGRALLFTAPSAAYYVALFVRPSRIYTVEIAGPREEVEKGLKALEDFVVKLTFP